MSVEKTFEDVINSRAGLENLEIKIPDTEELRRLIEDIHNVTRIKYIIPYFIYFTRETIEMVVHAQKDVTQSLSSLLEKEKDVSKINESHKKALAETMECEWAHRDFGEYPSDMFVAERVGFILVYEGKTAGELGKETFDFTYIDDISNLSNPEFNNLIDYIFKENFSRCHFYNCE